MPARILDDQECPLRIHAIIVPAARHGDPIEEIVAAEQRLPQLPDVPTFKELGYPSIVGDTWFAVFAPAGTPQPVLDKLSSSITRVVNTPDFAKRMEAIGNVPWAMTPAELGAHVVSERERLGKLIRDANITVE